MRIVDRGQADAIDLVASALSDGSVVVLPTDTVYGLAASVACPAAVSAIFDIKGRPAGLALPVLIGGVEQVGGVVAGWPASASTLAGRFWPGPLTLVVPALADVGRLVGGDGTTVGVRFPDHELVRALCERCGPLAVTSANRHGEPPCTTAGNASEALGDLVPLAVDGGVCDGSPSTVVDCTADPVRCLRDGALPYEALRLALE